jgi:hypothetical protein
MAPVLYHDAMAHVTESPLKRAKVASPGPAGDRAALRRGGMRRVGTELPRLTGPILGKQGLGEAKLLSEWAAIVGTTLAGHCWPVKLAFPRGQRQEGTLRLRVAPGVAVEIQHREPVILERINAYFGYRAVARLAIVQGPPPPRSEVPPTPPRPLLPSEQAALRERLEGVEDPTLRDALERLGSAIIGSG